MLVLTGVPCQDIDVHGGCRFVRTVRVLFPSPCA